MGIKWRMNEKGKICLMQYLPILQPQELKFIQQKTKTKKTC